jgi:predicted DNA-binding transcriptional regulator YafY
MRFPDRKVISGKFEISIRQAARDIEYMQDSLGAPIEYSVLKKGYYYQEGCTFELPAHYITEKDRTLLQDLASEYAKYGSSEATQLAGLFQRLTFRPKNSEDSLEQSQERFLKDVHFGHTEPYLAIVRIKTGGTIIRLTHPFIRTEDILEIEFYTSDKLLSELLGGFESFQIMYPNWLREKLQKRLQKILQSH